MAGNVEVISASDPAWDDLLELVPHDIYHTRAYHTNSRLGIGSCSPETNSQLSHENGTRVDGDVRGRGGCFLFSYQREGMVFLFPFVLRTLDDIPSCAGFRYFDVTSVYGYSGPLASTNASSTFIEDAWRELSGTWKAWGVVSAFTRFHPLLENVSLARNVTDALSIFGGEVSIHHGPTVSIDLRKSEPEQIGLYHKNLRRQVGKSYEMGFEISTADLDSTADLFVDLYSQTMRRRNASDQYLIDRDWIHRFSRALSGHCILLVAKLGGEVTAALLVMEYRGYVHAHLTGIDERFTVYSPLKSLLDGTRKWATARGNHTFHLGGGIGGRQDSLFQFKKHFSPQVHSFHTGCWVLNHKLYCELVSAQLNGHFGSSNNTCAESRPFPAYRFLARA